MLHLRIFVCVALALPLALSTGGCMKKRAAEPPPLPNPPAPELVEHPIVRTTFLLSGETIKVGSGFLIRMGGKTLLLTAHHLLGKSGGLDADITWDQMDSQVSGALGYSPQDPTVRVGAQPALIITDAAAMTPDVLHNDVAAFVVQENAGISVLSFAQKGPAPRDRVWLIAEIEGHKGQLLHPARVTGSTEQELSYVFDDAKLELRTTSGTPIVNARGEVVALHLGGGNLDDSAFGVGNPVPSLIAALKRAAPVAAPLKPSPPTVQPAVP